jgi:cytolysin (calcineurin-like family phosphatase)
MVLPRRAVLISLLAWALSPALLSGPTARAADRPTITFFVAGDSHFGAPGMEPLNRTIVEQMNALPGSEYPPAIGGRVDAPRGLLFMGDMTDNGLEAEWRQFAEIYGLTGKDGLLRFPVYEALGNHDDIGESPVKAHIAARHGTLVYSWDWDDLHVVCLDMYPDARSLDWLAKDLARVGRQRPLIVFFHYSILGPYSESWETSQKEAFAAAIEGYNVLAVFHGHFHHAGRYEWHGHDVFLPGSPRHMSHAFLVVRLTASQMAVGSWNFDERRWVDTFVKPIQR